MREFNSRPGGIYAERGAFHHAVVVANADDRWQREVCVELLRLRPGYPKLAGWTQMIPELRKLFVELGSAFHKQVYVVESASELFAYFKLR